MKDDLFKVGILFKKTHLFENEPVYDDTFHSHRLPRAFDDMQHAYYAGLVCEYGVKIEKQSKFNIRGCKYNYFLKFTSNFLSNPMYTSEKKSGEIGQLRDLRNIEKKALVL